MKPLSEPGQRLWRRLSVFGGSCSRAAVEAVWLGEDLSHGDYATARPLVADSLRMYRELGDIYAQAWSLGSAAGLAAGTGQPERALRLAGASDAHCAAIGVSQPAVFEAPHKRAIEPARRALDQGRQAALWAEGQAMPLDQAVAYALEERI